jgi:molybdenum cofactor guanylyltransferase
VGVILAGGLGRRLGGSKATVRLNGQPMITYPLRAVQEALGAGVIVAKAASELPSLRGVEVWVEPDHPQHPLTGVVHALGLAEGRPVLVCACDLPLVSARLVGELAAADPGGSCAVIARGDGGLQPLLGCYQPDALAPLIRALTVETSVQHAVSGLGVVPYDVPDEVSLFNVNTPEDLLQAGALLASRAGAVDAGQNQPNVKS